MVHVVHVVKVFVTLAHFYFSSWLKFSNMGKRAAEVESEDSFCDLWKNHEESN